MESQKDGLLTFGEMRYDVRAGLPDKNGVVSQWWLRSRDKTNPPEWDWRRFGNYKNEWRRIEAVFPVKPEELIDVIKHPEETYQLGSDCKIYYTLSKPTV